MVNGPSADYSRSLSKNKKKRVRSHTQNVVYFIAKLFETQNYFDQMPRKLILIINSHTHTKKHSENIIITCIHLVIKIKRIDPRCSHFGGNSLPCF